MLFKLNISLNEDDYVAFNCFHELESAHGKKTIRRTRIFFILVMAILAAYKPLREGITIASVIYSTLLLLITTLYIVFFKKILVCIVKKQIKRLKKLGKLPFETDTVLEFHEDKLVEITPSSRTEQNYDALERMCVTDRFILLYKSSVSAYILPVAQITTQLNQKELLDFLADKCPNVEYY